MQVKEKLVSDIIVYQDDELYTFTSDSILLSLFAVAKKGEVVADFCAGSGVVGLNFYALNQNLVNSITFFEVQSSLYELCKKSVEDNGLSDKCSVINTKLQDIESKFNGVFSLIYAIRHT